MQRYSLLLLFIIIFVFAVTDVFSEEHTDKVPDNKANQDDNAEWKPGPAFYGPQAQMMMEEEKEEPDVYQMRVKLPDGFKIPPHWFEDKVRLDVLSGILYIGSGDQIDKEQAQELKAGGYKTLPPEIRHYGIVEGPTIIKLTTSAPWSVNYVNPEDDPRKKK